MSTLAFKAVGPRPLGTLTVAAGFGGIKEGGGVRTGRAFERTYAFLTI